MKIIKPRTITGKTYPIIRPASLSFITITNNTESNDEPTETINEEATVYLYWYLNLSIFWNKLINGKKNKYKNIAFTYLSSTENKEQNAPLKITENKNQIPVDSKLRTCIEKIYSSRSSSKSNLALINEDSRFKDVNISRILTQVVKLLNSPNSALVNSLVNIGVVIKPMPFIKKLLAVNHIPDLMALRSCIQLQCLLHQFIFHLVGVFVLL